MAVVVVVIVVNSLSVSQLAAPDDIELFSKLEMALNFFSVNSYL